MKPENISTRDLERYLSGECSSDELYRIEKALNADPFLLESVEGFEEQGSLEGFEELQHRFRSKYGTASTPVWKKNTTWIIALLGAAVVVLSVMTFDQSDIDRKETAGTTPEKPEKERVAPVEQQDEEILEREEAEREIEAAEMIHEDEVITYEKALANQPKTVEETEAEGEMTAIDSAMLADRMNMHSIETPEPELELDPMVEKSNVKILYFHDLKVVDYTTFYAKKIKIRNKDIPTGTRVYFSDRTESPSEIRGPYTIIPYESYLEMAMGKFNRNKFKSALKDYNVIIDHFPEDVNAHFYGALCYYNLGKWENAAGYFTKVIDNPIYSFDQEAEFYLALTYKQNGEQDKARSLFRKIANDGKFYSGRAQQELKKL